MRALDLAVALDELLFDLTALAVGLVERAARLLSVMLLLERATLEQLGTLVGGGARVGQLARLAA